MTREKMDSYKALAWQLRRAALIGRQPPIGRQVDGAEELMNQAWNAIHGLLAEVEREKNNVRVETPLGAIIARPSPYGDEYPGIEIALGRPDADNDCELALVEFTDSEADIEGGAVITRVYGDVLGDEYTDRIVHANIDAYFKEEDGHA